MAETHRQVSTHHAIGIERVLAVRRGSRVWRVVPSKPPMRLASIVIAPGLLLGCGPAVYLPAGEQRAAPYHQVEPEPARARARSDADESALEEPEPECRMGADGHQACGYACRMGADGVMVCAEEPDAECRMGANGRVVCGYACRMGADGIVVCADTRNGQCAMGSDGHVTCTRLAHRHRHRRHRHHRD
jgi:hypothetical protein